MEPSNPVTGGSLILPFSGNDFGAFISGLLGKPQVIESSVPGVFTLTRDDVSNTFHLVDQRVSQQNECSFVQFTVTIVYADGSSVLLNSLEAFKAHVEVRPVVSEAVHLSWTYLIKFIDKKVPEKQVVELSFAAAPMHVVGPGHGHILIIAPHFQARSTNANIRIQHTARTWGVDMEALLTGHVKSLMRPQSRVLKWINDNDGWVALIAGLVFFGASTYVAYRTNHHLQTQQVAEIESILRSQGDDLAGVANRLDVLIQSLAASGWRSLSNMLPVQITLSAVASFLFAAFIGSLADNRPKSYVLLSKKAEEQMAVDERKLRRRWFEFAVAFVLGIVGGIISNILFARL
jgi:hypothetical protein